MVCYYLNVHFQGQGVKNENWPRKLNSALCRSHRAQHNLRHFLISFSVNFLYIHSVLCFLNDRGYTGLFISPSGISELDCATTKTDTAERSISIGRESLQVFFCTNRPSGPMGPDGLFVSQRTGSHSAGIHVPFTNYFVCRWFCVVHDPKPPFHSHNWLSFVRFQDTERFLIHYERHFSSRLPPSGGSWKYAKAPSTKKTWRASLPIDMLLSTVSVLVVAQSSSEIPEGLMNNPV